MKIKVDIRAAQRQLAGLLRQIQFAQTTAVNDLAFQVQRAENTIMSATFAPPRPFRQKATAVRKAATGKPVAEAS